MVHIQFYTLIVLCEDSAKEYISKLLHGVLVEQGVVAQISSLGAQLLMLKMASQTSSP